VFFEFAAWNRYNRALRVRSARELTQASGNIGKGDARVGQVDAAQPGTDDVVLQADNQVLRLVSHKHRVIRIRYLPASTPTG
jgi:hypothetical protein